MQRKWHVYSKFFSMKSESSSRNYFLTFDPWGDALLGTSHLFTAVMIPPILSWTVTDDSKQKLFLAFTLPRKRILFGAHYKPVLLKSSQSQKLKCISNKFLTYAPGKSNMSSQKHQGCSSRLQLAETRWRQPNVLCSLSHSL